MRADAVEGSRGGGGRHPEMINGSGVREEREEGGKEGGTRVCSSC